MKTGRRSFLAKISGLLLGSIAARVGRADLAATSLDQTFGDIKGPTGSFKTHLNVNHALHRYFKKYKRMGSILGSDYRFRT